MKKIHTKNFKLKNIMTIKIIAIVLFLVILICYLLDFSFEFSGGNMHLSQRKASFDGEVSINQNQSVVTIKIIPSNNQLPNAVSTGEGFDDKNEHKLLLAINKEREALGMNPLFLDINLQKSARLRSLELCENDYMEHLRPDGTDWMTAITDDVGISYPLLGENLARLSSKNSEREQVASRDWYKMWRDSETHYSLMTTPEFTHIGIGIYFERSSEGYISYVTAHFADESLKGATESEYPLAMIPE